MSATVTVTGGDANVALSVVGPEHGIATLSGKTVTYTPAADFNGTDSFTVKATEGTLSVQETVDVAISAVNDPPTAVADQFSGTEDVQFSMPTSAFLTNDTDVDGDTLMVVAAGNASGGSVVLDADMVTFIPAANFHGAGTFDYTVSDGTENANGHVTINFTNVNDAPVAVDDTTATDEDTSKAIAMMSLVANDTDADADTLTITAASNATHGTATINGTNIDFVPAANFSGAAGFDYTVSDGTLTDTGHVTVNVGAVNDAPVAIDDTATVIQDTAKDFTTSTFLTNDTDPDNDTLTITAVANPVHCTVVLAGTTITVNPEAAFVGAGSFDYTVSDGNGGTDTGTVALTIESSAVCGDGIISGTEVCDDGNAVDGDGCTACAVDTGFACANEPSVCTPICGDGLVLAGEACDDGGTANGDGCSATCTVESGFTCTGEPSVCITTCGDGITAGTEQCDDHNTTDHDGCSATCTIELVCKFTFTGSVGNEVSFLADAALTAPGVTNPAMTRGAGVNVATAANAFSGSSWNTAVFDDTAFYAFTVTPDTGVSTTMLTFVFGDQKSATGPTTWTLRSSLDNFAADLTTGTTHVAPAPGQPLTSNTFVLPTASFTAVTAPVEFRIYGFGASAPTGTWRIDNVSVIGFTQGP